MELQAAYDAAIASADGFLANKQYEEAKTAYTVAIASKPEDVYATAKVAEIESIVAELNRIQGIEESYNSAIAEADKAFAAKEYTLAREGYADALGVKPGETYPTQKISEIDSLIEEEARQHVIEFAYNKAITSADSLFVLKEYDASKGFYDQALRVKNGDATYPQQKINEIDSLLAEMARQKAIDESYALAITNADGNLERGEFLEALQSYEEASGIKPAEAYPKDKIAEINSQLSNLKEERQKAYDAAIVQADNYYNLGNYRSAKSSYQTAVNIKSDEQYARDRLDEVTLLYQTELEVLKVDYRKYIADADNYFKDKIYDGAIENYRLASGILPDEDYPGKMISRITQIINDNAITDVNKLAQIIPNNTERKFSFAELPVGVRKTNYILIKARNVSGHDFKMLVNFGQGNSKNGGVVLQVPEGEAIKDYIIRIGALYRWFSEDNDWLSIYPEGGDIEVALIRISKSD